MLETPDGVCSVLMALNGMRCVLEVPDSMRCVLLCMLEAVEGVLCAGTDEARGIEVWSSGGELRTW